MSRNVSTKSNCRTDKINLTASFWKKRNIPINSLGTVSYVVLSLKYITTEDAKSKLNNVLRTLTDVISEENYTVRFANHLDSVAILFLFT